MNAMISILLGAVITVMALFFIKSEIRKMILEKNSVLNSIDQSKQNELLKYILNLEKNIDQVNESFYEIVSDLEGKYSVHEKRIELLDESLEAVNLKYKMLKEIDERVMGEKFSDDKKLTSQTENSKRETITEEFGMEGIKKKDLKEEYVGVLERDLEGLSTREKIVIFRSEGLELHQIAKKLGLGVREIKLILNIRE